MVVVYRDAVIGSPTKLEEVLRKNPELVKRLYRIARLIEEFAEDIYIELDPWSESYVHPDNFAISVTRGSDGGLYIKVKPQVWYDSA